ncbi:UDP-N-acetylmuramoyl-L-alanyl-D-glutamate--2,6-diaminopimelate ligase [Kushneria aurantia]|uniref:UDP-N-acetylmuramoyl-L-alanyl-D-glutamate--2,6-diaminopimelate ligase n=1 Tax=Kushneria aurantia TaxID=504092 RepID=A0ABV6G0L2_9GAMM|nr:UDP-N-acetylmuramoyl-L-alanyl-D-glutamate--2,6-diaminopimelate ligase [Kushneria aurantia]
MTETVRPAAPLHIAAALEALWPGSVVPQLAESARLVLDSRDIASGDVFVAVPGTRVDGRDYIDRARARGAALILAEAPCDDGAEVLVLDALGARLGELASRAFDVPDTLEQIAVTGTNGKTSVSHYVAALSEALGTPCGLIGTLGSGRPGALGSAGLTTPDAISLQAGLRSLSDGGAQRVALEASSHALDQHRLSGCRVRAAIFTNLTQDHLDYHASMAAYAAAKARLFQRPELAVAVVNADDPLARLMLAGVKEGVCVLRVGDGEDNDFRVLAWHGSVEGLTARIATPEGERELSPGLLGRFNLDNVLLAIAALYGLGAPLAPLLSAAAALEAVPGRMQRLVAEGAPAVVVDYAHTPDALGKALMALSEHVAGRLWCLFGCGGERDSGKRALMGELAALMADRVVVSDDNPRGESAAAIRAAIMAGSGRPAHVEEIAGRRAAIEYVVAHADPDDVILIAGKGHENYQEIDGVRHPFSDVDAAWQAIRERSRG